MFGPGSTGHALHGDPRVDYRVCVRSGPAIAFLFVLVAVDGCRGPDRPDPGSTRAAEAAAVAPSSTSASDERRPRRGGVLLQAGGVTAEITRGPENIHRAFFDAAGAPVSGVELTLLGPGATTPVMPFSPGAGGKCWVGLQGTKAPPTGVRLAFQSPRPQVVEGPLPPMRGPQHGGEVHTVTDGTELELSVRPDGTFRVWVTDVCGDPHALGGVSGKVMLRSYKERRWVPIPDYPDLDLAPAGDHLESKGAPITLSTFTAQVMVYLPVEKMVETGQFSITWSAADPSATPAQR